MLHTTRQERLALGVAALLILAGGAARVLSREPPPAQWRKEAAAADTLTIDPVRGLRRVAEAEVARQRIRAAPLAAGERIDPNRASADELDRLPRVGPALAARLVEWRQAHGPFGDLGDLDAVPGVGPALLSALAPHLTLAPAPAARRDPAGGRLDPNRASADELDALPGVGPVLAARIVAHREAHGSFRSVEALDEVPGIGPALRARIAPHLRVDP